MLSKLSQLPFRDSARRSSLAAARKLVGRLRGRYTRAPWSKRVDCLDRQQTVGETARGKYPDRARKASTLWRMHIHLRAFVGDMSNLGLGWEK